MAMKTSHGAYAEFNHSGYAKLRGSLIRKSAKGSEVQRDFLRAVSHTSSFLEYIGEALESQDGIELEPLAEKMSESEFANPPSDTEQRLYDSWQGLTPRIACRPSFWARITYRHIEAGRIESSYLAANGGGTSAGAQRIDVALAANGDDATRLLDTCVRTVLRRLGGLPEARGNRSVYVNCPLARAWWREKLVSEVTEGESDDFKFDVRAVVHSESQQYWEDLVTFVVSRNSVFGSTEVRNLLIRGLARVLREDPDSPVGTPDVLKRVCRSVSSIQASFELSIVPEPDLEAMLRDVVQSAAQQQEETAT